MKEFYKCPICSEDLSRQSLSRPGQSEPTVLFFCRECNEYFVKKESRDHEGVEWFARATNDFRDGK